MGSTSHRAIQRVAQIVARDSGFIECEPLIRNLRYPLNQEELSYTYSRVIRFVSSKGPLVRIFSPLLTISLAYDAFQLGSEHHDAVSSSNAPPRYYPVVNLRSYLPCRAPTPLETATLASRCTFDLLNESNSVTTNAPPSQPEPPLIFFSHRTLAPYTINQAPPFTSPRITSHHLMPTL